MGSYRIAAKLIFCLALLLPLRLRSQHQYFKSYTVQDGLIANPIRHLFQDSKGFLWIATWEGLSRYDGYRFNNFTNNNGLSHNLVNAFMEVGDTVFVAENNGAIDAIYSNQVRRVEQASTAINDFLRLNNDATLVATDGQGFLEFRKCKLIRRPQSFGDRTMAGAIRLNDSLLLAHGIEQLLYVVTRNYHSYATGIIPKRSISKLYRDRENRIWVCTSGGLKMISYPIRKNQPLQFKQLPYPFSQPVLEAASITDMLQDRKGNFWFATLQGLIRLSPTGDLYIYTEIDGLPAQQVSALLEDREENIWVGTAGGLAKVVNSQRAAFINSKVPNYKNDVHSMLPLSQKRLLLATSHGLQLYEPGRNAFTDLNRFPETVQAGFIHGRKEIIAYYRQHLVYVDTTSLAVTRRVHWPMLQPLDMSACTDKDGHSFIATGKGIGILLENGSKYIDSSLPFRITTLVSDHTGSLWAGTWNNGLYRITYRPAGNDRLTFTVADYTHLIGASAVRSLYCDPKGNIWVGTRYNGAFLLKKRQGKDFEVQHFGRLSSTFILSFGATADGQVWIGSYIGLDKLVFTGEQFRVFPYSRITDVFAPVTQLLSVGKDQWYGVAGNRLLHFADRQLENTAPFRTRILSASFGPADKKTVVWRQDTSVRLSYTQNGANFVFSALSYINEKQVLYTYRLMGASDTNWSVPEHINEVFFASLSPRQYRFEVRTLGWNGRFGAPSFFVFTILPPFWQTWWFYCLCSALALSLVYCLYRYRVRQLLRWQKARDRIASDLHDDIGSTLTSISILSRLSSEHLDRPEQARTFLQRISQNVQASSQAMDDIIWSINSRNDTMGETIARMRRFAGDLFESSSVKVQLRFDEEHLGVKLEMEKRRDLYLIYKESLNNIAKHAAAKNVLVEMAYRQKVLYLLISDDGSGFDPEQPSNRNGLKNLKTRVDKWNGQLQISTAKGQGTTVAVWLPVMA